MQSGQYDPSMGTFLDVGDFPSQQEEPDPVPKSYGDSERELIVKQAPVHARVALGKEKADRKPVDPPPVIQLIDKRTDRRSPLYNSPYLFLTCSLVAENYHELTTGAELPTSYLAGSLASSIHHLKDPTNADGGYFVFGDLSVKREGRFRLRFTLYDRDNQADPPSVYFVSEIITNPFTVYSPKEFPGMAESTFLTRSFTDQGVKLRLRKDSRAITTRKRNRMAAENPEAMLMNRRFKRTNIDRSTSIGAFGAGSNHTLSPDEPQEFLGTPDLGVMSAPSTTQACLSTSNSSPSVDLSHSAGFLSSPITGQFTPGYPQISAHTDMTAGASLTPASTYNQVYHANFGTDGGMQQGMGTSDGLGQGSLSGLGVVPNRTLSSPYGVGSDQLLHAVPDMSPRTPGVLSDDQYASVFTRLPSHEEMNRHNSTSGSHYGVFQ